MALSPSDRIQLVTYPNLPGVCQVCKFSADGERKFIDFGLQIDYFGSVNICELCAVNVGQAVDMVTPDEFRSMQLEDTELRETNSRLALQNAQYSLTLDSILHLRPDVPIPVPVMVSQEGTADSTGITDEVIVESTSGERSDDPEPDESDSGERSEDVSEFAAIEL